MDLVTEFSELFKGLARAHGSYEIKGEKHSGKKTGRAQTLNEPVTDALWEEHLQGKKGLGIVPIDDDAKCDWGAADIDVYDLDIPEQIKKIRSKNYPLVPCRTKSGGLHLFLFVKKPIPASLMQEKLTDMAASCGFGGCEIFPKQTKLLVERGDVGSWLNMPYFNGDKTTRYCLDNDGNALSPAQFIEYANSFKQTERAVKKIKAQTCDQLPDGPPCLQHLATSGFPEGTRNDGLFNLGVYARKAVPDKWEEEVEELNRQYMDPPLKSIEVLAVVKSLKRKDYEYMCNRVPLAPHCNAMVCRQREHGIGVSGGGQPNLGSLTKLDTRPPIWFIDVEGERLELSTDDLQNQNRFQRRCMEQLNSMPSIVNRNNWQQLIQHLLDNVNIVEVPEDASAAGQFWEMLEAFATGRVQAQVKEELLIGKPWTENGRTYFRVNDLLAFLDRQHFRDFKVHQIYAMLKDRGAEHHFFNVKGKGINAWSVQEFAQQTEEFDVPDFGSDAIL